MFETIYLLLKAFGFIDLLPAGIPMILNILPNKVLPSQWDMTMSQVYSINMVVCLVIFSGIVIYYAVFYRVAGSTSLTTMWWLGFFGVFVIVYFVAVILTQGDLCMHDGMPVSLGEIIFPVGFFMALDCMLLYLVLSILFAWWPALVKGGLPPIAWFKR